MLNRQAHLNWHARRYSFRFWRAYRRERLRREFLPVRPIWGLGGE